MAKNNKKDQSKEVKTKPITLEQLKAKSYDLGRTLDQLQQQKKQIDNLIVQAEKNAANGTQNDTKAK